MIFILRIIHSRRNMDEILREIAHVIAVDMQKQACVFLYRKITLSR